MSIIGKVLAIPEIFEAVLLRLPQKDLLIHQRVCQRWYHSINTSPAIQRKLFLRPIPNLVEAKVNPLLKEFFSPLFPSDATPIPGDDQTWSDEKDIEALDWYKEDRRREQVLREDASWRKMFPVQPPAMLERVAIRRNCYCIGGGGDILSVSGSYWNQETVGGVRMGGVWDLLVHVLEMAPQNDRIFSLEWMMFQAFSELEYWTRPVGNDDESTAEDRDIAIKTMGESEWKRVKLRSARKNAITIHSDQCRECYPRPAPCAMKISPVDETKIVEIETWN